MPALPKPEKKAPVKATEPLPVDVKSSVPLSVQIAPESLASLGAPPAGTAEPVTAPTPTVPASAPATLGGNVGNPEGATPSTPVTAPQATTTTTTVSAPVPVTVAKSDDLTLAPTTTAATDRVMEGQRHINKIWEYSQAVIALMITFAVIYCAVNEITSQELSNGFFLIIGFYFSRQNHQNTGGVGPKPDAAVQSR